MGNSDGMLVKFHVVRSGMLVGCEPRTVTSINAGRNDRVTPSLFSALFDIVKSYAVLL